MTREEFIAAIKGDPRIAGYKTECREYSHGITVRTEYDGPDVSIRSSGNPDDDWGSGITQSVGNEEMNQDTVERIIDLIVRLSPKHPPTQIAI